MSQQASAGMPRPFRIAEMMLSLWVPQALYTAAVLRIPDQLAAGPMRGDELARAVGAQPAAIARLLRGLVLLEVCVQTADDAFALTPLGDCLRSDSAESVRSWTLFMGSPLVWTSWGRLADCVRTGDHAFSPEQTDLFEVLKADPEQAAVFNQAMRELTARGAQALLEAYDFTDVDEIVDVGGGDGTLIAAILGAHPRPRGVVFDLSYCKDRAEQLFEQAGLVGRATFASGDFFDAVPTGADVYLLKSVIHDWDDERGLTILRACRAAMGPGARLLLIEPPAPSVLGSSPFDNIIVASDLNMLVLTGGRERTEAEYRQLLTEAGLRVTRIAATPTVWRLFEAVPAG